MTENPATSRDEAKALLSEVDDTRRAVRLLTQRGGFPDIAALLVAKGLGSFADPRRLDYSGLRIGIFAVAVALATVMAVQAMQHRRKLGMSIGVPTLIAGAVVFLGNVFAFQVAHGDAREIIRTFFLGVAVVALAAAYRSAPLLLLGGLLTLTLPATLDWPVVMWLVPMILWIAVVGYFGRESLKNAVTL